MNDSDPDRRQSQSVGRALSVLDLFSAEQPVWSAEQICIALSCTQPTGYRYIRELVSAGLLYRVSGGFALGARIILLDYVMRQADPLLHVASAIMCKLAQQTGCDAVLTAVYGDQILDVHRESGGSPLALAYGRGRPRPLFIGAAPKVIVAAQPAAWVRALYDAHADEAAAAGMGADWSEYRAKLRAIRKQGFYISRGELEPALCAIAAPIPPSTHQDSAAAVAVVTSTERFGLLNTDLLATMVRQAARTITEELLAR